MFEFQRAHDSFLEDKTTRVIPILLENMDEIKETLSSHQNNSLQCYLETYTYLEWGSAYFWRNLRYAMPAKKEAPVSHEDTIRTPLVNCGSDTHE